MSTENGLTSPLSHVAPQQYAIIVAGGFGTRMQSAVPKQFLLLDGKPVLMHTLGAFNSCTPKPELILVLHNDYHAYWRTLCTEHRFNLPHALIAGGNTRFHSVKNAVDTINNPEAIVAVHDAVRALISPKIIQESFIQAAKKGNAVVAVKSRDSVRQQKNGVSISLLRDEIYLVQTPQTFVNKQLQIAYQQPYFEGFTDDASVVEKAGFKIELLEGDHTNLKITFPEDLMVAELLLNKNSHLPDGK